MRSYERPASPPHPAQRGLNDKRRQPARDIECWHTNVDTMRSATQQPPHSRATARTIHSRKHGTNVVARRAPSRLLLLVLFTTSVDLCEAVSMTNVIVGMMPREPRQQWEKQQQQYQQAGRLPCDNVEGWQKERHMAQQPLGQRIGLAAFGCATAALRQRNWHGMPAHGLRRVRGLSPMEQSSVRGRVTSSTLRAAPLYCCCVETCVPSASVRGRKCGEICMSGAKYAVGLNSRLVVLVCRANCTRPGTHGIYPCTCNLKVCIVVDAMAIIIQAVQPLSDLWERAHGR